MGIDDDNKKIDEEKDHKCLTCNGIGEIAVTGMPMLMLCFDCDGDGKVTAKTQLWQREHRVSEN